MQNKDLEKLTIHQLIDRLRIKDKKIRILKERISFLESEEYGKPIFAMGYNKAIQDYKVDVHKKGE